MSRNRSFTALASLAFAAGVLVGGLAGAVEPKQPGSHLDQKEFFKPELYISSSQVPVEEIADRLPNRAAWVHYIATQEKTAGASPGRAAPLAFIDPRSGAATNLVGAFPLVPGRGAGNHLKLADLSAKLGRSVTKVNSQTVLDAVLAFVNANQGVLGIDLTQLGAGRAADVSADLWQVSIPQIYLGVPVRYGRLAATINRGNLVVIGAETWSDVRGLNPVPTIGGAQALTAGFTYAGGQSAMDQMLRQPTLEIIPVAPPGVQIGDSFTGPVGSGYSHRLVWTFVFLRPPDEANWEVTVDAHSGEILAFQDINHYVNQSITGGVYPLTSTEICPTPTTCGIMQSGWPMPFADTGLATPNDFTNSAGIFNYTSGTVTTTLTGRYVDIVDTCGAISNSSATGAINLGGTNGQHDCTTGGGSAGNTPSSRTAFYEVNKLAEMARGWLPSNAWLQSRLTTNVNINQTCNAFWNGVSINFYRSGGGCRNTGELAGVFDHEWGHGLDDNDAGGALSSSSEAYADIAAIYRLQTSCVGHGFWWTSDKGCGLTADGTGFNANEAQQGASHCDLDCSGVRDADWDKHADHTPDTALGFVCSSCLTGGGPCGRQVHCAAAPSRQAAWDLVARDLQSPPFSFDSQTAFIIGNKLFYQGSGNIGAWHSCTCGGTSDGCGATNAYMQWLAADDDNGNLNDGTPHMTAIFNAFNRHGIACATPAPVNGGCGGGPTAASALSGTSGDFQNALSWTTVAGATRYWVFRTEGHAGCTFGKALIAETTGTSFTDTAVANGRNYSYNVVAAGASSACFGRASNCVTVTPAPGPPTPETSVWVSVNGNDANDCSRATPCRTFAGALAMSPPGGEIKILDSGDFGPVTINKSISLVATGVLGGIQVGAGTAITINAGANDKVVLRGLTIDGAGTGLNGISFTAGGSLYVENCTINNFGQYGIDFAPTSGSGKLFVTDTILRNNGVAATGGGLHLIATTGPGFVAAVDGLRSENNVFGLKAETLGVVTIRNSLAANNGFSGFSAVSSSSAVRMLIEDSVTAHNGTNGVLASGSGTTVTISNIVVTTAVQERSASQAKGA
jgi:trimeric autotransporter adhesin